MKKYRDKKRRTSSLLLLFYILIFFSVIISILPLFRPFVLLGADRGFHLNRLLGLGEVLKSGKLLYDINPYAQMGYGMADPIDYPFLFLYPSAFLLALGGG